MVEKVFERILRFYMVITPTGPAWIPLIPVDLIDHEGIRRPMFLWFDTGATTTTLRAEYAPLLGAATWTEGKPVSVVTAGGEVTAYSFVARLEVLGKVLECPVNLQELPYNPFFQGLLGREAVFEHFGFGFWERDHQLLITGSP